MRTAMSLLALALLPTALVAGEAELPPPTIEEMDKPTKTGGPAPTPLPDNDTAAKPGEDGQAPKQGVNPFAGRGRKPKYAVPARITWSGGKVLEGWVWRRSNAPIRIFHRKARAHEDFFLSDLKRIDVKPETENFERDWRWKNQGSSEKVFLDTGYLWNQYLTTFTATDGEAFAGDCSGQFYILTVEGKKDRWFLYKRHSGRDQPHKRRAELEPLVYVKTVEFTDDFLKKEEPPEGDEKAKVQ